MPRIVSVALLTILAYISFVALAPAVQPGPSSAHVIGVGDVRADPADDGCATAVNHDVCKIGYNNYGATGITNETEACKTAPTQSLPSCKAGYRQAKVDAASTNANGSFDQEECASNAAGFGWVACPIFDRIIHFFSGVAKDFMEQFLAVQPLQMSGPLYDTWSGIRLIANLAFVLIFMAIIFAHVLQYNLDSYAIKRMIPKLVAAAILVQFSYVLTSIMVDIGNILGYGVGGLISSVTHGGQSPSGSAGGIIENLTTLLAGGALASIAVTNIVLAAPVITLALISALGLIVTLAVRYFLIGILIVAAPLAIAAWVLPNTEHYFSRWLSTLFKLILMYPIIMALLSVAGNVGGLIPNATSSAAAGGDAGQSIATTVIKVLVIAGCFLMIPRTFGWAGGFMDEAHSRVNDLTGKARKGYWGSSGVYARQKFAAEKRIASAEGLNEGLMHGHGPKKYRWMHAATGGNTKVGKKIQGGLLAPATLLLAGESADRGTREYKYGELVHGHAKTLSVFDQAKETHNVENALNHWAISRRLETDRNMDQNTRTALVNMRDGYMGANGERVDGLTQKLAKSESTFLLDWTKTTARREAMMQMLGDKNQLKQPLQKHLQEIANAPGGNKADLAAFIRQDFQNYAKDPMLAGINTDMKLKDPQIPEYLRNLSANKIKNELSSRNWEVAAGTGTPMELAQSEQAARMLSTSLSSSELRLNFTYNNRDAMSPQQQMYALLAMYRNEEVWESTPAGRQQIQDVINQIRVDIRRDATAHNYLRSSIKQVIEQQGGDSVDLFDWMNGIPPTPEAGNQTIDVPPEIP